MSAAQDERVDDPAFDWTGEGLLTGVRLVVSPASGRLRHLPPARFHAGDEWVSPGQPLALVEQGAATVEVRSPVEARVGRVLVRDGEPVVPGQAIVWLEDAAAPGASGRGRRPR